jgi:hypothetical protein
MEFTIRAHFVNLFVMLLYNLQESSLLFPSPPRFRGGPNFQPMGIWIRIDVKVMHAQHCCNDSEWQSTMPTGSPQCGHSDHGLHEHASRFSNDYGIGFRSKRNNMGTHEPVKPFSGVLILKRIASKLSVIADVRLQVDYQPW